MSLGIPTAGPGVGLRFANIDYRMTATVAATKGDVLSVDVSVTNNGTFTAMTTPIAADNSIEAVDVGVFGVALEDIAAGATGMFRFAGTVEAKGGAAVDAGDLLGVDTDKSVILATTALKGVGYGVDAVTDGGIATIIFDGINGVSGPLA